MAKLFVYVAFALIVGCLADSSCPAESQETVEKAVMECVAHDPSLMIQIIEHMKNPKAMANMGFICSNKADVIDLVLCMEHKMVACLPGDSKMLIDALPTRQRWSDGLTFVCDHQEVFKGPDCMQSSYQDFIQCYTGKLQGINFNPADDLTKDALHTVVCNTIRMEEQCIRTFHGSCSQKLVELMIQMLEKFFPTTNCPVISVDIKNEARNKLLSSLLLHGQPLRFKPQGEVNYNIVKK